MSFYYSINKNFLVNYKLTHNSTLFEKSCYFRHPMATSVFHIDGVGSVVLNRRKGSKSLSMRLKPDGTISVNYPWFATKQQLVDFIMGNVVWIEKQRAKIEQKEPKFYIGQTIATKFHRISVCAIEKGVLRAVKDKNEIIITIPPDVDIASLRFENFADKVIAEVCRNDAKLYLPTRVKMLAAQNGFQYKQVFVKNLKSKWGSCSSNGNINLNVHLMRLPDHLIDYIILHELAHTRHMNHGEAFWELLNKLTDGKAKQLSKEIKKFKLNI